MARVKYDLSNAKVPVFTERFRHIVDDCGGVTKASKKLKISRPTVLFWYKGERTPDAKNIIEISSSFGISADYLLGIQSEKCKRDVELLTDEILESVNFALNKFRREER